MKMNKIWMWAIAAGAGYAIYKMTQKDEAPAVAIPEASETPSAEEPALTIQPAQVIHAPKIAQTASPAAPASRLTGKRQNIIRKQPQYWSARPSHMQVHYKVLSRDAILKKIKGRALMRRA